MCKRLFSLALWVCMAALHISCGHKPLPPAENTYKTLTLAATDQELTTTYPATLRGRQDVDIYPQVSGLITQVYVAEGADVRRGETLFLIDQTPYKAALATAQADVAHAEAAVATARLTLQSKEELYAAQVVSDFDLQTARNDLRSAEAVLAQAQANLISAKNNLSYTEVKSPVDGRAGMTSYRIGALVGPNQSTPLLSVSDNAEIYAYFSMSEKQWLSLSQTDESWQGDMKQWPAVRLQLSNGSVYGKEGHISAVSGVVDRQTGAVALRATFPNPGRDLRSGGAGSISLSYQKRACLVIPQEATFELQDKIFVYKVVEGKTCSTPITVFGINNGREYIVESGLQEGDVIIAEGAGLLRDGMEVSTISTKESGK